MADAADWVAVDWGTSRLRAWIVGADGASSDCLESDRGMGALSPDGYESALLDLISAHLAEGRATRVVVCGMAGARQGWAEAPYVPVPCKPPGAESALRVDTADPRLDVAILPGVSQAKPADVMRGEETQIAGFMARHPAFDGTLCMPGSHTKWVQISAGEIVSFRTQMAGEAFAALCESTVLRHSVGDGEDEAAFLKGVAEGLGQPEGLLNSLFRIRAEGLLDGLGGAAARARLSGLLVGLDLAGARGYWLGTRVAVLGAAQLAERYAAALREQGVEPEIADGEAFALDGLAAAHATFKKREG